MNRPGSTFRRLLEHIAQDLGAAEQIVRTTPA
jgi:hypothetical protein